MKTVLSLIAGFGAVVLMGTAASADSYTTTTTTTEVGLPVTQLTTVRTEPAVTVVREAPVVIEQPTNTTTIIKEKSKKHHHLIKLPFVSVL